MSIRINQELNNIKNSVNNLNIIGTDNKQAILTEKERAIDRENNILGALLIEKNEHNTPSPKMNRRYFQKRHEQQQQRE